VTKENRPPRTFVKWMLQFARRAVSVARKTADEQISGADTVDQLTDLNRNSSAEAEPINGIVGKARTSFQSTDRSSPLCISKSLFPREIGSDTLPQGRSSSSYAGQCRFANKATLRAGASWPLASSEASHAEGSLSPHRIYGDQVLNGGRQS